MKEGTLEKANELLSYTNEPSTQEWTRIRIDNSQETHYYCFEVDLPGYAPKEISIEIKKWEIKVQADNKSRGKKVATFNLLELTELRTSLEVGSWRVAKASHVFGVVTVYIPIEDDNVTKIITL